MKLFICMLLVSGIIAYSKSDAGAFGGGVRVFSRAPVMDTGETFTTSTLIEPYVRYSLNPQASIDLAIGYTRYDREPLNTGLYSTGEEVSGSDKSVSILAHAGAGSVKATFGIGNVWRSHDESYTVYGSIPYELDFGQKKNRSMVIAGILFAPVRYASIATQIRYHNSSDFWICFGIGLGF